MYGPCNGVVVVGRYGGLVSHPLDTLLFAFH